MPIVIDEPNHLADFIRLNELWIQEHFQLEDADRALAADPGRIAREGGHTLALVEGGVVRGVCALFRESGERVQLARMAVEPAYRGQGHGKALLGAALAQAEHEGYQTVFLYSNTVLTSAIALYRIFGFHPVDAGCGAKYARCNVIMERELASVTPSPGI